MHIFHKMAYPCFKELFYHPRLWLHSHGSFILTFLNILYLGILTMKNVEAWNMVANCVDAHQYEKPLSLLWSGPVVFHSFLLAPQIYHNSKCNLAHILVGAWFPNFCKKLIHVQNTILLPFPHPIPMIYKVKVLDGTFETIGANQV